MGMSIINYGLILLIVFLSVSSLYLVANNLYYDQSLIAISLFIIDFVTVGFIISGVWYVLNVPNKNKQLIKLNKHPNISIVIPCHNEPFNIVKRTFDSFKKINYPKDKLTYYLLDDSTDLVNSNLYKKMCVAEGYLYISRDVKTDFKAGNVNNFLFNHCKDKLIALFDADEELSDFDLFNCCVPQFQNNKVAYVQTMKYSRKGTLFENAMSETNAIMFNLFQPVNSMKGLSLFCGSSAVLNSEILKQLGGFPKSIIEDVAYSLRANLAGFKGKYINWNFVIGEKIQSFSAFKTQHFRYNKGNSKELIDFYLPNITKIKFELQGLYFIQFTGLHYVSIGQVISSLTIIFVLMFVQLNVMIYLIVLLLLFVPLFTCVSLARIYSGSFRLGLFVYLLNFSIVIARIWSAIEGIFNFKSVWVPTANVQESKHSISWALLSNPLEIVFGFSLIAVGLIMITPTPLNLFIILWTGGIYLSAPMFSYLFG